VPGCGVDFAEWIAGFRARDCGAYEREYGADLFRYAGVERRAEFGEFGVWADGRGDGDERGLYGVAGDGSGADGLTDVYGNGDGTGWDDEHIERIFVCAFADAAERERGYDAGGWR